MAGKLYSALVCLALICSCQGRFDSSEILEISERILKGVSTENVRLALENLQSSWDSLMADAIISGTVSFEIDDLQTKTFVPEKSGGKAVQFGKGEILVKGHYILKDLVRLDETLKFNGNGSVEFKLIENYLVAEPDFD